MQMSVDTVLERVGDICSSQDPFMIKIGKPAMFGPRDELSGFQVEPSKELQHLHRNLLRALGGSAVVAGAREDWLGDNYSPHIIPKQGCSAVIEEGEIFLVDRLHVVARKSNDMKVVAGVLNLGGVQ
jgi:2'-5' RNA ligase